MTDSVETEGTDPSQALEELNSRLATMTVEAETREAQRKVDALEAEKKKIEAESGKTTEDNANVRRVIDDLSPENKEERSVYPRLASRALYGTLPAWQREFRSEDGDHVIASYLNALRLAKQDGGQAMRTVMGECKRANLLEGDSSAAGAAFDGTAGEMLPLPLHNAINIAFYRDARMRRLMQMITLSQGASLRLPQQNAVASTTWTAEAVPLTQGEGTVSASLNLQLQKQGTLANLSNELLEDAAFAVVQWLTQDVTSLMAEDEDEKLYGSGAGAGSDEPSGLEAEDTIVTMTTAPAYFIPAGVLQTADFFLVTDIDYAHILKMYFSLPEAERRTAIWSGPDEVMKTLSLISDDSERPIFQPRMDPVQIVGDPESGATINNILGRPVFNLPGDNAAIPTDSNSNRLYFWNPRRTYAGIEKGSVKVALSEHVLFNSDITQYRFTRRVDGGVLGNAIAARPNYVFTGGITGAGPPTDS